MWLQTEDVDFGDLENQGVMCGVCQSTIVLMVF